MLLFFATFARTALNDTIPLVSVTILLNLMVTFPHLCTPRQHAVIDFACLRANLQTVLEREDC